MKTWKDEFRKGTAAEYIPMDNSPYSTYIAETLESLEL